MVGLMFLSSLAGVTIGATVASANTTSCPHGHTVSEACFYGHVMYAAMVDFHSNRLYITKTRWKDTAAINQTLWLYSTSPCTGWQEVGIAETSKYSTYKTAPLYTWYTAWKSPDGTYHTTKLPSVTGGPNGVNHRYEIAYLGGRHYEAVITKTIAHGETETLGYGGCEAAAGAEATSNVTNFSNEFATTFTITPLKWESTTDVWHTDWTTKEFYVGKGCTLPKTNPLKPPECMNGTYYGSNEWADNKPQ